MPIPLIFVAGGVASLAIGLVGFNTLEHEAQVMVTNAAESVIKHITMVLMSGYSLVVGFPGYMADSIMFETIGYVDPFRTAGPPEMVLPFVTYKPLGGTSIWTTIYESVKFGFHDQFTYRMLGQTNKESVNTSWITYDQLGVANEGTLSRIRYRKLV